MNEVTLQKIEDKINDIDNRLEKLETARRRARFFKLLYIGLVIGLGFMFYYYLSPYYQSALDIYDFSRDQAVNLEEVQADINSSEISDLINLLQN